MSSPPRALPAASTRRLAATLYAYAFLDEFVLLYPLYTLLFAPQRKASSYSPLSAAQSFPPSPIPHRRRRPILPTTP
jgi:hypothetical protein